MQIDVCSCDDNASRYRDKFARSQHYSEREWIRDLKGSAMKLRYERPNRLVEVDIGTFG